MMMALLEGWKLNYLHLIIGLVAISLLDRVDPVMDFADVMPATSFWVNGAFLSIPNLSIPNHLEGVVAPAC
jgi:hypothetical protein